MTASIFAHLEASLHQYLGEVAERARQADEQTAAAMARVELPRIAEALRAVLEEHQPDEHGRCPRCRASRLGRTPAPCRAYLSAHLCLLVAEDDLRPPDLLNVTADSRNQLDAPG